MCEYLEKKYSEKINEEAQHRKYEGVYERSRNALGYIERYKNKLKQKGIPHEYHCPDDDMNRLLVSLSSFPMSPAKKDDFISYYHVPEQKDPDLELLSIKELVTEPLLKINTHQERIEHFVELLKDEALKLRYFKKGNDTSFCKFALVGRPGTGKTAFINYCFSVYGESIFDANQVMYSRVNLNDVVKGSESLKVRMLSKWLRIFCKYYLMNDNIEDFIDFKIFKDELLSRCKKYKKELFFEYSDNEFNEIVNFFFKIIRYLHTASFNETDYSLSDSLEEIDPEGMQKCSLEDLCYLTEITMSYVQHVKNWGNIIIFDGFDRVTFDKVQFKRFESWCTQIKKLTSIEDNDFCRSLFIVSLRDYSIRKFFKTNIQPTLTHLDQKTPAYRTLSICNKMFREVIENRFELLDNQFNTFNCINIKRNIINLMIMCYGELTPKQALDSKWSDVSKSFENIFSFNYRLLFKFIRDLILLVYQTLDKDFDVSNLIQSDPDEMQLLEAFQGNEWRVLKLFITGTFQNIPFSNRTTYTQEGQPSFQGVVPIIPNIFNFNEYAYRTDEAKQLLNTEGVKPYQGSMSPIDQRNKLLVKYFIIKTIEDSGNTIGIETLVETLRRNFCDKWHFDLIYEIRELIFSNIIGCDLTDVEMHNFENIKNNYPISLTLKSKIFDHILGESVYYENIIDDTPIDNRFSKYMSPLSFGERDTWDYLKLKTKYIIFFITYVEYVQNYFKDTRPENDPTLFDNFKYISKEKYAEKFLIFTKERKKSIFDSIVAYLNGFLIRRPHTASKLIDDWFSEAKSKSY